MIPGTALGVLLGDLVYTWMAFRLARRTGRDDVTAMPLGLDTPSTFGVAFLVLLPALNEGYFHVAGRDHEQAMAFAWHVGLVILVLVGDVQDRVRAAGQRGAATGAAGGAARLAGGDRPGADRVLAAGSGRHRRRAAGRHGGAGADPVDAGGPPRIARPLPRRAGRRAAGRGRLSGCVDGRERSAVWPWCRRPSQ